jgi:hypothetical protein
VELLNGEVLNNNSNKIQPSDQMSLFEFNSEFSLKNSGGEYKIF